MNLLNLVHTLQFMLFIFLTLCLFFTSCRWASRLCAYLSFYLLMTQIGPGKLLNVLLDHVLHILYVYNFLRAMYCKHNIYCAPICLKHGSLLTCSSWGFFCFFLFDGFMWLHLKPSMQTMLNFGMTNSHNSNCQQLQGKNSDILHICPSQNQPCIIFWFSHTHMQGLHPFLYWLLIERQSHLHLHRPFVELLHH